MDEPSEMRLEGRISGMSRTGCLQRVLSRGMAIRLSFSGTYNPKTSQDSLPGKQWLFSAGQNVGSDQGSGEARPGPDTERPARTEVVGNPTDDRCADWCSPECNANS